MMRVLGILAVLFFCAPKDVVGRLSSASTGNSNSTLAKTQDDHHPEEASSQSSTLRTNLTPRLPKATAVNAFPFGKSDNKTSLCERIHPEDLPPECSCSEPFPYSLVVECLKPFNSTFFNDTIGMKIVINPCDPDGASVSIDVTEQDHNIDYPLSGIRANEEQDYPIPGLAVIVPGLGHVGLDVAVLVTGNLDSLTLKIGLNACVALVQRTICASSIPGLNAILPWYVLSGTYKFGDICDARDERLIQALAAQTAHDHGASLQEE